MASPDNTIIYPGGGTITDAQGNIWTVNTNAQVTENGQLAGYSAGVVELAYEQGNVWQENYQSLWWEWNPSSPDNNTGWSPRAGTATSPVRPTTRTWLGGGNNEASNPTDWSPNGLPQPGDTLLIGTSTASMNIEGNDLAGDTLSVSNASTAILNLQGATANISAGGINAGPLTLNLMNSSNITLTAINIQATANISGTETLHVHTPPSAPSGSANLTVNLAANSTWIGTVAGVSHYSGINLTINPGVNSTFENDGASDLSFHSATITVPVIGNGSISALASPRFEFTSSVGAGQSVSTGNYPGSSSVLQLDDPAHFLASVTMSSVFQSGTGGGEEIDLEGLANADSYSFKNDMLNIWSGNKVIDTLRLTDRTQFGFDVVQTAGSVNVVARTSNGQTVPGALPIHRTFTGTAPHSIAPTFHGPKSAYAIKYTGDDTTMVADSDPSRDGIVTSINNEVLQFSDQPYFIESADGANIARLYQAGLGRIPDPAMAGLFGWEDIYTNNVSANAKAQGVYVSLAETSGGFNGDLSIADGFIYSPEFIAKYGTLSNADFVTQLYQNVLGRGPDPGGLNGWLNFMSPNNGGTTFTRSMVLVGFAESPENILKSSSWMTDTSTFTG